MFMVERGTLDSMSFFLRSVVLEGPSWLLLQLETPSLGNIVYGLSGRGVLLLRYVTSFTLDDLVSIMKALRKHNPKW